MTPRRLASCALLAASLQLAATSALGATYHVPSQVPTIQGALNLSQPGDSVLVAPAPTPRI